MRPLPKIQNTQGKEKGKKGEKKSKARVSDDSANNKPYNGPSVNDKFAVRYNEPLTPFCARSCSPDDLASRIGALPAIHADERRNKLTLETLMRKRENRIEGEDEMRGEK